ncbi:CGNR zinc finger domain-containing protein [Actinoplanes sp. CA-131856]
MTTSAPILGEPLPVELMNTVWIDRHGEHDAVETPGGLAGWLRSLGPRLPALEHLGPDDVDDLAGRLVPLRDALRLLAAEVTQDTRWPRPGAAALDRSVAAVNAAVVARTPQLVWTAGAEPARRDRPHADGTAALVSAFAEEGIALFGEGGQTPLRACYAPNCGLYFAKDHPRREFCSPGCSNRARAARHYQRRRRTGSPA